MASAKQQQQDTIANVNAAKAIDKVLTVLTLLSTSPSLSLGMAINPMEFILQLLKEIGITYEELVDFLTNFLTVYTASLEIAVKAILLTNLKTMVSCSIDPRIPDKYRKQHKVPNNTNTSQEYGIDISLETIDFFNKLTISPLSDEGKNMYFGLSGVTDVYKFARADDFDAFLWFVMHKGHFPNSSQISDMSTFTDPIHGGGATNVSGNSLLEKVEMFYNGDLKSNILQGNTFTYTGSPHIISMCIDSQYDKSNEIMKNTLVPVSDDWNSVNWYIRRANQLTKNLLWTSGASRDYNKEIGICNLQFLDQATSSDEPITGLVNNKFRFTILPKPLMHIPNINEGEPPWRFKKLLFNSKGEYDPNGKYTLADISDSPNLEYLGGKVTIDKKSGEVTVSDKNEVVKNLMECYKGLTVYEFNYDYVMGMKLFDPKTIVTNLFDSLKNMRLGLNVGLSVEHQEATDTIREILKNIINSDDSTVEDCFFTFSNEKYDALLRNTAEKKAKRRDFKSVIDILNEYDDAVDVNGQIDVLKRTITQAAVSVTEGVEGGDEVNVQFSFVTDLIEQLTLAIVKSVLSPKVLMLLEVNETIMGGKRQKITFEDLLIAVRSIIISIIREIRDLILQELTKLLLKHLAPIVATLQSAIVREQLENYTEAINDIIRNCPSIWWSFGGDDLETKLDTVDYADIESSKNNGVDTPTKNC